MDVHDICWILRNVARYAAALIVLVYVMRMIAAACTRLLELDKADVLTLLRRHQEN